MKAHAPAPAASGPRLTLYLPGLFGNIHRLPPQGLRAALALWPEPLARLLARAESAPMPARGAEAALFALFGVEPTDTAGLPVAAVGRVADFGVVDREWWIRADPVHLEPRRDGLVLQAIADLPETEAVALTQDLADSLAQEGWLLKIAAPTRWYLRPAREPQISTTTLPQVLGRDIRPWLPQGPDGRAWHARLNEAQILLHTASVNAEREAAGRLPVNSVWFWGGGSLPQVPPARWGMVWTHNPIAAGLARLAGCTPAPPPADPQGLATGISAPAMLVLDAALEAAYTGSAEAWCAEVAHIANTWILPLMALVNSGDLDALDLHTDAGFCYRYRRGQRWRFWRRDPLPGAAA